MPTLIRPRIPVPTLGSPDEPLEAALLPLAATEATEFLAWAEDHHLQPDVHAEHDGLLDIDLTTNTGTTRVRAGTWVVLHHAADGVPYLELCDPEHFVLTYELVRPLQVLTFRDIAGQHRWRVVHTSNGKTMATSGEGYTDTRDRDHAIELLWPDLDVTEETS